MRRKNTSWVEQTSGLFIKRVERSLGSQAATERNSHLSLQIGKLVGLEYVLLDGQTSRLSAAVGTIATTYDPSKFNFSANERYLQEPEVYKNKHTSEIRVTRTRDGTFQEQGLPEVSVAKSFRDGIVVHLQYTTRLPVLGGPPSPRPSVDCTETGVGAFDLTAGGLRSIPFGLRDELVSAVSAVTKIICSPDVRERAVIDPLAFCPEIQ